MVNIVYKLSSIFQASLETLVTEEDGKDNTVSVGVVRTHGFFGKVVVKWSITGDQNGLSDLTPLEGMVGYRSSITGSDMV